MVSARIMAPLRASRSSAVAGWAAAVVLVVAILASYAGARRAPFLFDDYPAVVRNHSIERLWPPAGALHPPLSAAGAAGRPVVNLSLALDFAAWGRSPAGYHVTNILLHAIVALLLWRVLHRTFQLKHPREMIGRDGAKIAFFSALLWAVHPLLTESVICVVQRNELLVAGFILLTLYALLRAAHSPRPLPWLTGGIVATALAAGSKELAATIPLIALLFDRSFLAGTFKAAWQQRKGFYLGLAGSWALVGWLILQNHARAGTVGFGLGISAWTYALTQCQALVLYLKLVLWPHPLVVDYGRPVAQNFTAVWAPALVIIALLGLTVYGTWRRSGWGFLGATFFLLLAPSSSFVPLTTQTIAEHRMYLPAVLLVIAITTAIARLVRQPTGSFVVAALALGWSVLVVDRARDYRSEIALWTDTIAKAPENARAYASLGMAYARQERWNEAATQYVHALQLSPDFADAQNDYASVLLALGQNNEAVHHYELAARLKPADPEIRYNLGHAYIVTGASAAAIAQLEPVIAQQPEFIAARLELGNAYLREKYLSAAISTFEAVVKLQPANASAHHALALALMQAGQATTALSHFERVVDLDPRSATAQNEFGLALATMGRDAEAISHFAAAVQLDPRSVGAQVNWANALENAGDRRSAAQHYAEAVRLEPGNADLRYNLGNLLLQLEQPAEAANEYGKALALRPSFAPAHYNLGLALVRLGRPSEAISRFVAARNSLPDSAAIHHSLGSALAAVGRTTEAIVEEEAALRCDPHFDAARNALAILRAKVGR
jgi:protein O-mannosyl-transferase